MIPPFGFSVGNFINAVGLIAKIRKALKGIGGAEDNIRMALQDLQQLELVLNQLKDGDWGDGADISHINAVRGVALSGCVVLEDFLRRLKAFMMWYRNLGLPLPELPVLENRFNGHCL